MQKCITEIPISVVYNTGKVKLNDAYKQRLWLPKFSIAILQTKVDNCNNANKSCHLQLLHAKAIAALTQFCDFCFQLNF